GLWIVYRSSWFGNRCHFPLTTSYVRHGEGERPLLQVLRRGGKRAAEVGTVTAGIVALLLLLVPAVDAAERVAFRGASGWASETPGGRGGEILKVTSLAADGPGSLRAALDHEGPRIIVFETG